MQLQDYKNWYNGVRSYEEGKVLYLFITDPPDKPLCQYLKSWSKSSFLEEKLAAGIKAYIDNYEETTPEDENLKQLQNRARELQESHKKLYYLIQNSPRLSDTKRMNLAMDLLDIADLKRNAWDAVDRYKESGELPPDPNVPDIDIDINDPVAIHEKLYQTNLNIFRHKNNTKKAALVQKHIRIRDYLTAELQKFKRNG